MKKSLIPSKPCFWLIVVSIALSCSGPPSVESNDWSSVLEVISSIESPEFPDADFPIIEYGAVGDGETDCTEAFAKAIEACNAAGGGRVVVDQGTFLTGAIHLKSHVNLYVGKGATILFSQDPLKYLPVVLTRYEGVECMNYSPFIYALGQENIAITGRGTLDGNADLNSWWVWKGRTEYGWEYGKPDGNPHADSLFTMAENGVPVAERVFGEGHYLRPVFIQPYACRSVLIDSVTIKRSPMWEINPVLCENVTVQNITVSSHGPNNDGCNPECSKNVLIKNCFFDTGDDCIAIKSGRNADGRRINVPSENIVVQGCTMKDGHGGVVIGSEMSGGCRNVFIEDCVMDSPNLERALRIKTNSMRGGFVENVYMRNVRIGEVSDAIIRINFDYGEGDAGDHTPLVRNIFVSNVTSQKSRYAVRLAGYERSPIVNLQLADCRFDGVREGNMLAHARDLAMKNVYINGKLQSGF